VEYQTFLHSFDIAVRRLQHLILEDVALSVFFSSDPLLTDKAALRGFPGFSSLIADCLFLPPAFIDPLSHVKIVFSDNSGKWTDELV